MIPFHPVLEGEGERESEGHEGIVVITDSAEVEVLIDTVEEGHTGVRLSSGFPGEVDRDGGSFVEGVPHTRGGVVGTDLGEGEGREEEEDGEGGEEKKGEGWKEGHDERVGGKRRKEDYC